MADDILIALMKAWLTCCVATALFVGALALSPYWDKAIFFRSLQCSLGSEF
jgi:hypothetical protein